MGSCQSHSSRKTINERSSSQLSPTITHTNGSVDEEESSSRFLQETIDSSNLSAEKTSDQKHTEMHARWQAEINVKEYFELLKEETNQEKKLTNQEILSRKNSLFRFLNETINTIHTILRSANEDEKWTKVLHLQFFCLACFSTAVRKIGLLPVDDLNKYLREAGQQLSRTHSVKAICKVVRQGWKKCSRQFLSNAVEQPFDLMLEAMSVLWSFSDYSPEVTFDITAEVKFLNTLRDMLSSYRQERIQGKKMETVGAGPVSITPMSVARPNHPSSLAKLKEWTHNQVNDWLDGHHLPKDVLGRLTGIDLAALIRMKDSAPENFYRYLETKLKLESLSAMETFIEALDHL